MNYGTVADFIEYHESRGRTIPAQWTVHDNAVILSSLLVASEWIDHVYGKLFVGHKTGGYTQVREWPRTAAVSNSYPNYVFTATEIPQEVLYATYEAAFRQATTPGSLMLDYTPNKYKKVAISGALSVDYADFTSSADIQTKIGIIDSILEVILDTHSDISSLSGGATRV